MSTISTFNFNSCPTKHLKKKQFCTRFQPSFWLRIQHIGWLCLTHSWHSTASRQSTAAWSCAQAAKPVTEVGWEGTLGSLILWLDNHWYLSHILTCFKTGGHIYWFKTSFSTSAVPYSQSRDSRYKYTPSWNAWGWWVGWLALLVACITGCP